MNKCVLLAAGIVLSGVTFLGTGCKATGPQNFEDTTKLLAQLNEFAITQGVSWSADLVYTGDPRIYQVTGFGLDTGIRLSVRLQGNAQDVGLPDSP